MKNACIVLDDAKYHKCLQASTPRKGWKEELLQKECERLGIAFSADHFKDILWQKLETHATVVKAIVVTIAAAKRHEVFYSPPSHSRLQPIEMVWAIIKGDVGRGYQDDRTFQEVRHALDNAFAAATLQAIYGCVKKSEEELKPLYKYLQENDELGNDDSSSGESAADANDTSIESGNDESG
ncbi:hypothetical protein ACHHYP_05947 [Achlya hypogyna]|uniref:Tc1-like transposase DDE domain-containing protein n=1 Tax=Achlya hypogyna TaxID=1202772 RepID=A0A1V9YW25_ACHHY|nr:hypothetical protein ACHHYP_05947 [Achlya hypogyna]